MDSSARASVLSARKYLLSLPHPFTVRPQPPHSPRSSWPDAPSRRTPRSQPHAGGACGRVKEGEEHGVHARWRGRPRGRGAAPPLPRSPWIQSWRASIWSSLDTWDASIWSSLDTWDLAVQSKQLWEELAADMNGLRAGGARESLGWLTTGKAMWHAAAPSDPAPPAKPAAKGKKKDDDLMLQEKVSVLIDIT